ncbi:MAG: hypothetical protein ABR586_05520 [Thermoplasmatota archaeon]
MRRLPIVALLLLAFGANAASAAPVALEAADPAGDVQWAGGEAAPAGRFSAADLVGFSAALNRSTLSVQVAHSPAAPPGEAPLAESVVYSIWFTANGAPFLLRIDRALPAYSGVDHHPSLAGALWRADAQGRPDTQVAQVTVAEEGDRPAAGIPLSLLGVGNSTVFLAGFRVQSSGSPISPPGPVGDAATVSMAVSDLLPDTGEIPANLTVAAAAGGVPATGMRGGPAGSPSAPAEPPKRTPFPAGGWLVPALVGAAALARRRLHP